MKNVKYRLKTEGSQKREKNDLTFFFGCDITK